MAAVRTRVRRVKLVADQGAAVGVAAVFLAFGVAGLLAARTFAGARWYLIVGGLIYLALWLYGTFSSIPREALPLNGADNWLHFAIGVVMTVLGLTLGATRVPTGADGEILVPE